MIDCTYGAAHAGRLTHGHRALHPEPVTLTSADLDVYVEKLRAVDVVVCPKERRNTIGATGEGRVQGRGMPSKAG